MLLATAGHCGGVDADRAVLELYGLAPEEFTAARNALVQATEDVERLYAELAGGVPALLAVVDGRPVSVITKADLLEFVAHQRHASR